MHDTHSMIKGCSITGCSYNENLACHAVAITVGGPEPECDTYARLPVKGGVEETGEVGACKVISCMHNSRLECIAGGITIGSHLEHADCMTYVKKA